MLLKIAHTTTYRYDEPVHYSLQQVRLTPKPTRGQNVLSWKTVIEGGTEELHFDDQHNNHVILVSVKNGQNEVVIHSEGEVETTENHGILGAHRGHVPLWFFQRKTHLTKPGPNIQDLLKTLDQEPGDAIERLHGLSSAIAERVAYETGKTHPETTAEDALFSGHGVCQDHAHIFITAARALGYPARYVSGYLMMNDRIDQDAGHAWAEAHVDNIGWVGFDVSNNISPDERYVRVATGLDYSDAAPISGVRFGDSTESMIVSLQVQQ